MTGPAVDLAAVRTARTALAAIVAEHPELTGATARARLAANLPEIIAMPPRLDPDSADSTIVGVRMTPEMLRALDAEVSRQRGLNPDVSIGRSNVLRGIVRRALLGSIVTPSTSAPAAPAAPAPMRPVVSRVEAVEPPAAAPVDPRQLPLLAPVAPVTGNDNEAAQPKPVEAPLPDIDLDALKVRVRAAITAKHSERSICTAAGLSESALNAWLNKPGRGLRQETARKVDPVLRKLGH